MPTGNIWNIGWLNANSQRSYPLSETATRYDVSSSIQIPNDLLVDMVIMLPASNLVNTSGFYVKSLAVFSLGAIITLGYDGKSVAVASVPHSGFTKNSSYRLVGEGDFLDLSGSVTIGSLDNLLNIIPGFYVFDIDGARIESTVIKPDIRGVSSISIINGIDQSDKLYGDIILVAGQNIRFSTASQSNIIRIDAVPTDLAKDCPCDTSAEKPCIKTVNGVGANHDGDLTIRTNDCLVIEPTPNASNSLEISDVCSKPCCGCEELQVIQTDLALMQTQVNTIQNLADNIQAQLTQLSTTILASKVGASNPCDQ